MKEPEKWAVVLFPGQIEFSISDPLSVIWKNADIGQPRPSFLFTFAFFEDQVIHLDFSGK